MKIILISGKAEAGKTTTAKFLKKKLGEQGKISAIVPYGQYVKDTTKMLFDWDGNKDEKGRALLQWWGTDVVRKKHPDFWIDTVMRLAKVINDVGFDFLIIDDCRFPNEIENWKRDIFGVRRHSCGWRAYCWDVMTVRIERPGHENALTEKQRQHPSECALDGYNFDVTISATNQEELEYAICEQLLPKIDGLD